LNNFPHCFFLNSPAFYILYVYFVSPYFDHDAFMHHPMHVLDAPGHVFILLSSIRVYFQPFAIGRMYRWLLLYVL